MHGRECADEVKKNTGLLRLSPQISSKGSLERSQRDKRNKPPLFDFSRRARGGENGRRQNWAEPLRPPSRPQQRKFASPKSRHNLHFAMYYVFVQY